MLTFLHRYISGEDGWWYNLRIIGKSQYNAIPATVLTVIVNNFYKFYYQLITQLILYYIICLDDINKCTTCKYGVINQDQFKFIKKTKKIQCQSMKFYRSTNFLETIASTCD